MSKLPHRPHQHQSRKLPRRQNPQSKHLFRPKSLRLSNRYRSQNPSRQNVPSRPPHLRLHLQRKRVLLLKHCVSGRTGVIVTNNGKPLPSNKLPQSGWLPCAISYNNKEPWAVRPLHLPACSVCASWPIKVECRQRSKQRGFYPYLPNNGAICKPQLSFK